MTLSKFLLSKTEIHELCVITMNNWIKATVWIDSEDAFLTYVNNELLQREVKNDFWYDLSIVNENNAAIKVPAHFIDL